MRIKSFTEIEFDTAYLILGKRGLLENGRVQKAIDLSVVAFMEPYMPMDTGTMISNMTSSTNFGSGYIDINVPYATYVDTGLSSKGKPLNYQGSPMRGANFFERMKADHFHDIVAIGQKELNK